MTKKALLGTFATRIAAQVMTGQTSQSEKFNHAANVLYLTATFDLDIDKNDLIAKVNDILEKCSMPSWTPHA